MAGRLLMLGGTGFLGPHVVRAALERGHEVTLLNRGETNPHLFRVACPGLERLVADRYGDLEVLAGRHWDAAVDTLNCPPRVVEASAKRLAEVVEQYVYVSSISVYADLSNVGITEGDAVLEIDRETRERFQRHTDEGFFEHYGAWKALCEAAATEAMSGRTTVIRPGLIVGPGDRTGRFTYWPVRVAEGGEVLAPGSPADPVQYVDVRDLAAWIVLCIERRVHGTYNAVTPPGAHTIGSVLDACRTACRSDATLTWVDRDFLARHEVMPWSDLPLWMPPHGATEGFHRVQVEPALARGLRFRDTVSTAADTLAWFGRQPLAERPKLRGGLPEARETEVLAAWASSRG